MQEKTCDSGRLTKRKGFKMKLVKKNVAPPHACIVTPTLQQRVHIILYIPHHTPARLHRRSPSLPVSSIDEICRVIVQTTDNQLLPSRPTIFSKNTPQPKGIKLGRAKSVKTVPGLILVKHSHNSLE